jgi:hypothetical protein
MSELAAEEPDGKPDPSEEAGASPVPAATFATSWR